MRAVEFDDQNAVECWLNPHFEMVKRKASISIDEWLDKGLNSLTISPPSIPATVDCEASTQCSTAEEAHSKAREPVVTGGLAVTTSGTAHVADNTSPCVESRPVQQSATSEPTVGARGRPQPVPEVTGDVASNESEAAEWFWRLLEQAGYERW